MSNSNNLPGFKIVMAFLLSMASVGAFSQALNNDIQASANAASGKGKITVQDHEHFVRASVDGGAGIYEILNQDVDRATGICSIDKGKLPDNEAFVFSQISIGYSASGASASVSPAAFEYTTKLPAAARNSEFEIKQNGNQVLLLPTGSLNNAFTGNNERDQWTELGALYYLSDEGDITFSFRFATGQNFPSGSSNDYPYAEVRLKGYKTVKARRA